MISNIILEAPTRIKLSGSKIQLPTFSEIYYHGWAGRRAARYYRDLTEPLRLNTGLYTSITAAETFPLKHAGVSFEVI